MTAFSIAQAKERTKLAAHDASVWILVWQQGNAAGLLIAVVSRGSSPAAWDQRSFDRDKPFSSGGKPHFFSSHISVVLKVLVRRSDDIRLSKSKEQCFGYAASLRTDRSRQRYQQRDAVEKTRGLERGTTAHLVLLSAAGVDYSRRHQHVDSTRITSPSA